MSTWFFTRPSPLAAELASRGETILSTPEQHVDHLATKWGIEIGDMDSSMYGLSLDGWIRQMLPDFVVMVDPLVGGDRLTGFGYPRDLVKKAKGLSRRVIFVALSTMDPGIYRRYQGKMHKHCLCRIQDFGVWLTNDEEVAHSSAQSRRTALWSDVGGVLRLVEHLQARTMYKGTEGPFRS